MTPRNRRNDLLARFGGDLESLRIACGKVSYSQLRRTSAVLPPATTSDVLRGKSNPRIEFVLSFVEATGSTHAGNIRPQFLEGTAGVMREALARSSTREDLFAKADELEFPAEPPLNFVDTLVGMGAPK